MSEHITHVAVFEDAARLALISASVHEHLKLSLRNAWTAGLLGSVTRLGDEHTLRVLAPLRPDFGKSVPDAKVQRLLAYTMGWRCHNSADRQFKPVYRYLQPEHYVNKWPGVSRVTEYHDVAVFKEVYDHGRRAPMTPLTLAFGPIFDETKSDVPAGALQGLFRLAWKRELLGLQTFDPQGDVPGRFQRAALRVEPLKVSENRYAEIYHRPDPALVHKYLVEPNFYDRQEAWLMLAERLRAGKATATAELSRVRKQKPQSQYAQAVVRGLSYIEACSAYLQGKIDERTLKDLCDLERPHKPPEVNQFLERYKQTKAKAQEGAE